MLIADDVDVRVVVVVDERSSRAPDDDTTRPGERSLTGRARAPPLMRRGEKDFTATPTENHRRHRRHDDRRRRATAPLVKPSPPPAYRFATPKRESLQTLCHTYHI